MKVYERQITRQDDDYDNVTKMLGDLANRVPDERCWMVYDERPHLEVETFVTDDDGEILLTCELPTMKAHTCRCTLADHEHVEAAVHPERSIVWID